MNKIYCCNCAWMNGIENLHCNRPLGIVDSPIEGVYMEYGGSFGANSNYNCEYYKRKWWKFWVKEDK